MTVADGNHDEQEKRFKAMLARLPNSKLYRDKLSNYPLQTFDLTRIGELPLTTKDDLRAAGATGHLAVSVREVARYFESTGTSGEPSASWFTQADLAAGGMQLASCGADLNADDLILVRFPYALALPAFLMEQAANQTGAGIVPASGRTVVTPYPRVLELVGKLGVTVMAGLPREMELLAECSRLLGGAPAADYPALRAIIVAGELLGDRRKSHIEALWGVPVYNLFGSTETSNIAAACSRGALHVADRDYWIEALREDGATAAGEGERGFAAVTTLSHQGSPLLRYWNGDVISLHAIQCPCGRAGSAIRHYGRGRERLTFGNVVLDSWDVQEAVYALKPVPVAWKVMEQAGGLHVMLDAYGSDVTTAERFRQALTERLGVRVTVDLMEHRKLLDRAALIDNTPSTKPVYIQKL
ncbi:MAG: phenylacetate--CoA ligase family protein [Paenibacillus sp.]|nr:phenylacetate--CoA ligase family protein [Paenibacillus sp.]